MPPNSLGNITRRKMRVGPLGHAGVLMAELCRDYAQGNPAHREQRGMGVPQNVKRWGRGELGPSRSLGERPLLMRGTPGFPVSAQKNPLRCRASRRPLYEQLLAFLGQNDMPRSTTLGLSQRQRIAVSIEVSAGEIAKL